MNNPYNDLPIIDIHAHIMDPHSLAPAEWFQPVTLENSRFMSEMLEHCGFDALSIPAITLYDAEDLPCNPLALYAKYLNPERIYAFAGLRRDLDIPKNIDMKEQLINLLAAGFDGVKMICKPNGRRLWNVPINDVIFDDFYAYLEEYQIPVLFHVGDPDFFWDINLAPDWCKDAGWYYGDDKNMPDLKGLHAEVENVLERFPRLRMIFAHFFFMSDNLEHAADFMERFPEIRFDLTPGSDMYDNFTKYPEKSREFFIKYQDRLIFGTDNVSDNGTQKEKSLFECVEKVQKMRQFFETTDELTYWGLTWRGLGLPKEICRKIYADNFHKVLSHKPPKKVDVKAAYALCEQYLALADLDGKDAMNDTKKVLIDLMGVFER